MSDSETEEIVDNVNNESVDWGGCIDVPEAAEEVKAQQPLSSLYTIQEESYLSTVASRPRSVVAPTVPATLDKNASRSFTDDGLASSFQAPNMTSNSAEFCKNVDGIRQMMEEEQAAFDTSGRRLDLPSNFNPNHFRGENNSWDKGPYQWDVKQTASPRLVQSNPDHLEQLQPAGVVKLTMDNTQKNSPEAPVTPAKSRKFEAKITPVRPAQERVTALRDRNSPRLSVVTATSTPKGAERATSRLPDWEVSAINANNTTAADNTTGVEMPPEFLASVLSSMPPNAPTSDIMATVERLRCARVQKSTQRAEAREKFRNDTASSRMEERKTTTMLGTRNLDRRPPMNPVVRLPTVEEERMDSSRVSSRSNSRQTTAGATDQNEANTAHRRNSDPLTSHPSTDHTNPLLSRAPSQAISRASSTMSLFRTDTRLSSASSSNKMLRVTGTTGKILAFGPCEKGMELVKTIILTNLLDRAIRVTAELSKGEKGAYRILEGRLSNIGPKESTPLRIEFKPLSSHRHNNTLYIKSNCSQAGQYSIALRGMGGMASIELLPNENLHMTTKGYVIKKNALYGAYNFQLKSVGSLAFCKVVVTTCDTYPVEAKISPTPYVILKTGQIQNFTVEISPTEAAKLRNLPIVDKDDPFVSLEVKFFWGDEYFRQRAMEYLKKKGEQHLNGSFHVAETYLNEKKFVEPADYTCNISDVSLFESGLCSHIVKVISAQPRASRVSMHLTESTLKPDDTLACLMSNDRERTIVRDYNDTTYMT